MEFANQFHAQFVQLVNSLWRYRWHALVAAWAVCATGWILVASLPNTYTSSARIFVDTSSILSPLLKGVAAEVNVDAELELMKQTLTSRANMVKLARMTDLDISAATPTEMESLLNSLKGRIEIETQGQNLLMLSFDDRDPARARDVVQALITIFIETNLGQGRQDIDSALEFLDWQIKEYEQELEKAEQRMVRFKRDRLSVLPDQTNYSSRIYQLQNRIAEAEAEVLSARNRRDNLRVALKAGRATDAPSRIRELEFALQDLRSRFTEQHPDVIAARRVLNAVRNAENDAPEGNQGSANGDTAKAREKALPGLSIVTYEQLKIDLLKAESDVVRYTERTKREKAKLVKLEAFAAQIPIVEAELAKLNRNYDVMRLKHAELVTRREQARLAQNRGSRAQTVRFKVVDPPRLSTLPNGPQRYILLSVVLVFGIGAGATFAWVLGLANETFSDATQLRKAFSLPVLGTVSPVGSLKGRSWRAVKSSAFAGVLVLLFGSYGGLVVVDRSMGLENLASSEQVTAVYQQLERLQARVTTAILVLAGRL